MVSWEGIFGNLNAWTSSLFWNTLRFFFGKWRRTWSCDDPLNFGRDRFGNHLSSKENLAGCDWLALHWSGRDLLHPLLPNEVTSYAHQIENLVELVSWSSSHVHRFTLPMPGGLCFTRVPGLTDQLRKKMGGVFRYFLFSSLFGEDFPIWLIFFKGVETTN